jgi:hypothetical protein
MQEHSKGHYEYAEPYIPCIRFFFSEIIDTNRVFEGKCCLSFQSRRIKVEADISSKKTRTNVNVILIKITSEILWEMKP